MRSQFSLLLVCVLNIVSCIPISPLAPLDSTVQEHLDKLVSSIAPVTMAHRPMVSLIKSSTGIKMTRLSIRPKDKSRRRINSHIPSCPSPLRHSVVYNQDIEQELPIALCQDAESSTAPVTLCKESRQESSTVPVTLCKDTEPSNVPVVPPTRILNTFIPTPTVISRFTITDSYYDSEEEDEDDDSNEFTDEEERKDKAQDVVIEESILKVLQANGMDRIQHTLLLLASEANAFKSALSDCLDLLIFMESSIPETVFPLYSPLRMLHASRRVNMLSLLNTECLALEKNLDETKEQLQEKKNKITSYFLTKAGITL